MNANYKKDLVLEVLYNYIKQIDSMDPVNKKKYSKVYRALKDSISLIESLSDMNIEETNEYFRLLMASISSSVIIR